MDQAASFSDSGRAVVLKPFLVSSEGKKRLHDSSVNFPDFFRAALCELHMLASFHAVFCEPVHWPPSLSCRREHDQSLSHRRL